MQPSMFSLLTACLFAGYVRLAAAAPTAPAGLSEKQVTSVRANALNISSRSWEIGTVAEALTELSWPSLSVFGSDAIPPPSHLSKKDNASDVLAIAETIVKTQPAPPAGANALVLPLIPNDGATGDPASVGNAVLLANWTRTNRSDTRFAAAAEGQLHYLLDVAPRSPQGAISHRADQVQLWADFVYMAPPFIAYYGALQGGEDGKALLQEAYDQCRLYRDQLFDAGVSLWRHIALGSYQDNSHWGTGNGWAAAGMLRVLETIRGSDVAHDLKEEQRNLTSWINEVINGTWVNQKANGTLYNYLDDATSFADSSSTALLASVTYRMATLTNDTTHIPAADRALRLISDSVDGQGWLQNTVDPLTFSSRSLPGAHSPEGQSFVLLLQAAWGDYAAAQIAI